MFKLTPLFLSIYLSLFVDCLHLIGMLNFAFNKNLGYIKPPIYAPRDTSNDKAS